MNPARTRDVILVSIYPIPGRLKQTMNVTRRRTAHSQRGFRSGNCEMRSGRTKASHSSDQQAPESGTRMPLDLRFPGMKRCSSSPPIFVLSHFLAAAECDALVELAAPHLARSKTAYQESDIRTSSTTSIPKIVTSCAPLLRQIHRLTGKPYIYTYAYTHMSLTFEGCDAHAHAVDARRAQIYMYTYTYTDICMYIYTCTFTFQLPFQFTFTLPKQKMGSDLPSPGIMIALVCFAHVVPLDSMIAFL